MKVFNADLKLNQRTRGQGEFPVKNRVTFSNSPPGRGWRGEAGGSVQSEEQREGTAHWRWCAISQASTARAQTVESGGREHSLDLLRDAPQGAQRVLIRESEGRC